MLTPALRDYSVTTCVTGRFPMGLKDLYQLGFLSNEMTWPRLQKGMRATLLYALTLYCCWTRCWFLPGPGRGGPDQLTTLCGQQARLRRAWRPELVPRRRQGCGTLVKGAGHRLVGTHGSVHSPSLSSHWLWAPGRIHPRIRGSGPT